MLQNYPYVAIVVALSLFVYIWVTIKVGGARAKYKVAAPAVDGPVEFQRVFRVHMNTLEQIVVFFPALFMFAAAWGDPMAAAIGIFWPFGRILYAQAYYTAAEKRGLGFGLTFIPTLILLIGGLIGAVMQVV